MQIEGSQIMGRPPGSKNKPKNEAMPVTSAVKKKRGRPPAKVITGASETVTNPRAVPGDNTRLSAEEERALLFQAVGKIKTLKTKVDSLIGEMNAAYKAAKADGVLKKEIDLVINLQKKDPDELRAIERRRVQIYEWCHPGIQATLFDDFDRTPEMDKAKALGRTAGYEGAPRTPPYPKHTEQYNGWLDGYAESQQAQMTKFSPLRDESAVRRSELRAVPPPPQEEEDDEYGEIA